MQLSSSHVMSITFVPFESLYRRMLYFADVFTLLVITTCRRKFCCSEICYRGQFKDRSCTANWTIGTTLQHITQWAQVHSTSP